MTEASSKSQTASASSAMTVRVFLDAMLSLKVINNTTFVLARDQLDPERQLDYEANILELALRERATRGLEFSQYESALLIINTVRVARSPQAV